MNYLRIIIKDLIFEKSNNCFFYAQDAHFSQHYNIVLYMSRYTYES